MHAQGVCDIYTHVCSYFRPCLWQQLIPCLVTIPTASGVSGIYTHVPAPTSPPCLWNHLLYLLSSPFLPTYIPMRLPLGVRCTLIVTSCKRASALVLPHHPKTTSGFLLPRPATQPTPSVTPRVLRWIIPYMLKVSVTYTLMCIPTFNRAYATICIQAESAYLLPECLWNHLQPLLSCPFLPTLISAKLSLGVTYFQRPCIV